MDPLQQAQLAQAQRKMQQIMGERESYIRVTALLSNYLVNKSTVPMLDGRVCVKKSAFEAVPKVYAVGLREVSIKTSDDPNAVEEPYLVVTVDPKPEPTRIIRANGTI